ncbi:MAG: SDR family oxidoreductase [Flavobacteriales bacterium]|nr:SDR family oxidoreductase [Flavobacteriales bacterium]MCB9446833.1 SDR family oxidoreductase [Flavobacteriales bacterium]
MDVSQLMLREGSLNGQKIVITGGGTGLGKSMAEAFLHLGAHVVITSRKMDVLEATAEALDQIYPSKIQPVVCDVRDYSQVEAMLEQANTNGPAVSGLVNNAAGNFISPTEKLSNRAFDAVVDIVLKGSYNTTLAFGKKWIADKQHAVVLNIVTTYAWTGSAYVVPSACAKAGVLALTRSLAVEWAPYHIRLNAIAPGPFPTKGAWERLFPESVKQIINPEGRVPLGRAGEHHELANLASYLVSDFSAYMTGEVVTIDGGEWLKGAGQFNVMSEVPKEQWDLISQQIRQKKS